MGQIAELIADVLNGKAEPEQLGPSWAHDLAMPIYEKACQVLDMPRDKRRAEIEAQPKRISDLLALEVKRIYLLRK